LSIRCASKKSTLSASRRACTFFTELSKLGVMP
jgi:hypothetical protein